MCKESVLLQIEKLKICRRGSRCPEYAELGHFTLLFCRERLGNVPRLQMHVQSYCSGVRFSKDPKTSRARKLFGAVFGRVFLVPESVSQSARVSPEIFGDVFGKCNARNSARFNFPACDWFKNCN